MSESQTFESLVQAYRPAHLKRMARLQTSPHPPTSYAPYVIFIALHRPLLGVSMSHAWNQLDPIQKDQYVRVAQHYTTLLA